MPARLPPRPRTALSRAFALLDGAWSLAAAPFGREALACRDGCFGCCLGLFALPVTEALAVREAWRRLPADAREEVRRRAGRLVERSALLFPGDAGRGILDPGRTDAADERFFESVAGTPCPLLELPPGRCRAYAARPVTCRTYGLPLARGEPLVEPGCALNLVDAAPAGRRAAALDAHLLLELDQAVAAAAQEAGLPAGAETTIAHALAGSFFAGAPRSLSAASRRAAPRTRASPPPRVPEGRRLPPPRGSACALLRKRARRRGFPPAPSRG